VIAAGMLRRWFLAAALILGLALPAVSACSGSRGRRHSPRVRTERSKRTHHPPRSSRRSRHPRHAHAHPHPHPASSHHHHPHPHPHLDGPDGHHHPH
jgi:hypothetical protein